MLASGVYLRWNVIWWVGLWDSYFLAASELLTSSFTTISVYCHFLPFKEAFVLI